MAGDSLLQDEGAASREGGGRERTGGGRDPDPRPPSDLLVELGTEWFPGQRGKGTVGGLGPQGHMWARTWDFRSRRGGLCLGPDVSDILGGWQMLKKRTNKGY